MRLVKKLICRMVCLLVLFGAVCSLAENSSMAAESRKRLTQYTLDTWLVKDGLPSGTVNAMVQTPDGYIWLATAGGLVRFDGAGFSVPLELQEALKKKLVIAQCLLVGRDGALWITVQGALCRIKDGKCTVYRCDINSFIASGLFEASDGTIWIMTVGREQFQFKDGQFHQYTDVKRVLHSVIEDRQRNIWFGSLGDGIFRVSGGKISHLTTLDGLSDMYVNCILEDSQGRIWAGTRKGLCLYREGRFECYSEKEGLSDKDVTRIYEDSDGVLWLGTSSGGLNRMVGAKFDSLRKQDGLTDNRVLSLCGDREGSLWIGTNNGLCRLKEGKFTPFTMREGLALDRAVGVIESRDKTIWVFSDGGGITTIKDGVVRKITAADGLSSNYGGPLYEARDGSIWAGTANGLSRIKDGRITRYSGGLLAGIYVSAIFEDDQGLIVAINNDQLFRFDEGKLTPYPLENMEVLRNLYINMIYMGLKSRDGSLYLAMGRGLARIKGGRVEVFGVADGLPAENVFSIYEDREGVLWIGTGERGMARMKDGIIKAITMENGLYDDRVYRVLDDDKGYVWMSSPRGVFRVSKSEIDDFATGRVGAVTSIAYDTADGMKSSECNGSAQPCGWRTRSGELWFPTFQGVVTVDPSHLKTNTNIPPVVIEQVVVDDKVLQAGESLVLVAGSHRVEFHFNGLSLLNPEKVQFKYMLEGYDSEWISAGNRRAAYYTGIPPGRYRFRVIACNNDGLWNEVGASMTVQQRPWFYQTTLFYLACALALGLVSAGAYRLRISRLKARELQLKKKVEEAVAKVKRLSGLLPICANCKKVRDDRGYFIQIEAYIKEHSDSEISHSICPECMRLLYPEVCDEIHAPHE